jgi:hypothetical protein
MPGLTWLHLSDWHQRGKDFHRELVRDALIEDIKKRREIHPDLEKLDFIVFSGDLAFSGKKEEYLASGNTSWIPCWMPPDWINPGSLSSRVTTTWTATPLTCCPMALKNP